MMRATVARWDGSKDRLARADAVEAAACILAHRCRPMAVVVRDDRLDPPSGAGDVVPIPSKPPVPLASVRV